MDVKSIMLSGKTKKGTSKGYILRDSISITFSKWPNYRNAEQISGLPGVGLGRWCDWQERGSLRQFVGGDGTVLDPYCVVRSPKSIYVIKFLTTIPPPKYKIKNRCKKTKTPVWSLNKICIWVNSTTEMSISYFDNILSFYTVLYWGKLDEG